MTIDPLPPPPGTDRTDAGVDGQAEGLGRLARISAAVTAKGGALHDRIEHHRSRSVLVDVALRLYERDREAAGTIAGSAVAFRLFLFFVPMVVVLVGVAGFLSAYLSADDATSVAGVSGALAVEVEAAFSQTSTARWTALAVGLVGMTTSGRSLAKALVLMSALSWRVSPKGQRATVRITATVVGIMLSLALCTLLVNLVLGEYGLVLAGASLVGVAGAYFIAWLALGLLLPRATPDPGALLPGAFMVGATMAVLQGFTQLYLPGRVSQASSVYGGLGVTIVTLGWFFIIGRLAVLSTTVDAVLYERVGSITTVVFSLPLVRVLPARSPRLATFFGLDVPADEPGAAAEADADVRSR